jgi:hypothetical protein
MVGKASLIDKVRLARDSGAISKRVHVRSSALNKKQEGNRCKAAMAIALAQARASALAHYAKLCRENSQIKDRCCSGAARMSPTGLQTLGRGSQCALIISHKFLDTTICEFVCGVEDLPGKV